ncbi:MAG: DUF2162 domain-containing protein [Planctomycetota bacterium]
MEASADASTAFLFAEQETLGLEIMEYQTLVLGLILSLGVFAVKNGFGFSFYWNQTDSVWRKWSLAGGHAMTYLLIFMGAGFVLKYVMSDAVLSTIVPLMKGGMYVHFIMAVFMLIWAILLLRRRPSSEQHGSSRAWLLLVVPCPVCLTVVFLSSSILTTVIPGSTWVVVGLGFGVFSLITLVAAMLGGLYLRRRDMDAHSLLGGTMLGIAAFFILTICMAPHFQSLEEIYRLAANAGTGTQTVGITGRTIFYAASVILLLAGFACSYKRMKEV